MDHLQGSLVKFCNSMITHAHCISKAHGLVYLIVALAAVDLLISYQLLKLNMMLKLGKETDSSSDDESDYNSDDSFSSSDDSSDDEATNDNSNTNTVSCQKNVTDNSEPGTSDVLNEDDEDNEVIKAIIKSREIHRNHPPKICLEDFVVDISFHPEENLIAAASITGDVLLYEYNNDECNLKSTLELHMKACRDIEFSQDGKVLFSTAKDLCIILTDTETEKMKRVYENAHEQPVYTMTVINENLFATGDDDGTVKLWDLRQKGNNPVFSLKEMEDYVSAITTNSESKYLVCASGDGSLTTFNIAAKKMHVQSMEYEEELTCLGLFRSETKLLTASNKGKLYIYNWGEFGYHSDELPALTKKAINCMAPITENIVVLGGEDGILRAMSIFPNQHLGVVGQHNFPIEALDINNDGSIIASSSHNNDIQFWNVKYFETLNLNEPLKGSKQKRLKHNLPSSKIGNASDFFSDL